MRNLILLFNFLSVILFSACNQSTLFSEKNSEELSSERQTLSLACWNTQTFFDSEFEGTEYEDYQNLAKWSRDKYLTRLSRLCEVMTALDTDIIVLEEIENASVVQDIANQFAGNSWGRGKNWSYACFGKEAGAAIGCAVFSKYPLSDLKIHSMNIQTQEQEQPSSRPLLQVSVNLEEKSLLIFVNHWKSKASGEVSSEIWRDWQESLLAERINAIRKSDKEVCCVLCGDFNRDAREFICNFNGVEKAENVTLRGSFQNLNLYSPWFDECGDYTTEIGSYYYEDDWERIDHIFLLGNINFSAFTPRAASPWAASDSTPKTYKLFNGEGYSDHLPLVGILTLL
ncbi:MAG: endonuclease/exonuclease/phosphatase family protein [Treponema sp.]|nr:endonuclease/exonuclease/phosphatase family protein [Treponema sp.]